MSQQTKTFFLVSLVACLVGAILTLFTNFAGFTGGYNENYYATRYVHLALNNPVAPLVFLLIAVGFLYGAYVSLLGILGKENSTGVTRGFLIQLFTFLIIVVGATIFMGAMWEGESYVKSWWFDIGFFGTVVMSVVTIFFFFKTKLIHFDIINKL